MFPVRENMVASPFLLSCSGRRFSANEVCTAPAMTPRLASAALPSTCYIQPSLFLDYRVLAKQASTNATNRSTALTHSCVCAKKPFMKRSILFVTRYLSRDYITHARTHPQYGMYLYCSEVQMVFPYMYKGPVACRSVIMLLCVSRRVYELFIV